MPRKLDPLISEVLKEDGFDASAVWDCHGTWVVYHRVLEQIAAKRGIEFNQPYVVEANGKEKIAAVCVTGQLGERVEWSIGEAAPYNNKNAYPYAMAEKRAKDRVILKLIGLHGLAYSEDEVDEFKEASAPQEPPAANGDAKPNGLAIVNPEGKAIEHPENARAFFANLQDLLRTVNNAPAFWDANKQTADALLDKFPKAEPDYRACLEIAHPNNLNAG